MHHYYRHTCYLVELFASNSHRGAAPVLQFMSTTPSAPQEGKSWNICRNLWKKQSKYKKGLSNVVAISNDTKRYIKYVKLGMERWCKDSYQGE